MNTIAGAAFLICLMVVTIKPGNINKAYKGLMDLSCKPTEGKKIKIRVYAYDH